MFQFLLFPQLFGLIPNMEITWWVWTLYPVWVLVTWTKSGIVL